MATLLGPDIIHTYTSASTCKAYKVTKNFLWAGLKVDWQENQLIKSQTTQNDKKTKELSITKKENMLEYNIISKIHVIS